MASSAEPTNTADPAISTPNLRRIVGDSRVVACGILVSRITGFGRIAIAAAVLGPTFFGNLFQTTAVLPSTVYGLLMGTLISAMLVPPLVRRMANDSHEEVQHFAGAALGMMLLVLLSVALLMLLASPLLLRAVTAAVVEPAIRRQEIRLGLPLLAMVLPQIPLYGVVGAGIAVQQACGRFALPAIAPAIENIINIAILAVSAIWFGIGTNVAHVSLPQLLLLGLGTTSAVTAHATVQWIGAYRAGVCMRPRFDLPGSRMLQILRRGSSSVSYTSLYWGAYLIVLVIVGSLPGGVAAFQIAHSLCQLPVMLAAVPLVSAQLPHLSASYQRHEMQEFGDIYRSGLRLLMFMIVPASLSLVALPHILANAMAFGAMHSPSGVALIRTCLAALGIGVIGEAVFVLTTPACYARQDTGTPVRAMALRLVIAGIGAIAVRFLVPPGNEMTAPLCATLAAANLVAGTYLCIRLRTALPRTTGESSGLASALAVSLIALVPAMLLIGRLPNGAHLAGYGRVGVALVMLGVTITLYLATQFLRGSRELRLLLPIPLGRRMARPGTAGM